MQPRIKTPSDGKRLARSARIADDLLETPENVQSARPDIILKMGEIGCTVQSAAAPHNSRLEHCSADTFSIYTRSSPALALPRLLKKSITRRAAPELPACCPPAP